jgi:cell division septation protein DedD
MTRKARTGLIGGLALATTLAAVPAFADVKRGVDAWTRGDYASAVLEWAAPAAKGDADAQFNMAQAYRLGRGVDTDLAQAEALYAKAAAQGHVKAADNYGLLLFQRGARADALPYIAAAASRGDPRAQYLMGIAHFNGDLAEKDWQRAYALLTLANSAGLPQARGALVQMDEHIPVEDRQAAQALAAALKNEADAERARQLAAVDLALVSEAPTGPVVIAPPAPRARGNRAGAGVSSVRPTPVVVASPPAAPDETVVRVAAAASGETSAGSRPVSTRGQWKIQIGAFSVPGNAERLWSKVAGQAEITGHEMVLLKSGTMTRLLAGGYQSKAEAEKACNALKRKGHDCFATR